MKFSFAQFSLAAVAFAFIGCSGGDLDRVGSVSTITNRKYGEDTYQPREYKGLDAAPGLVFIEGGTFHMGGSEKDVAYARDNAVRQVTVASYFIDQTEIANVHWKEFVNGMSGQASLSDDIIPDTTVWYRDLAYNDPYVLYYYSHPGFNMYPVVGVSWYQCNEFAKWRTKIVNDELKANDPEAIEYPRYRLPTEAEWEYAARGLLEQELYPWEGKSLRDLKGRFRANFKRGRGDYAGRSDKGGSNLIEGLNDAYMLPAQIFSMLPNDFGLYHMAGNVAEWTLDTYRVLAFEDIEDLNPYRRRGQTSDPYTEDVDYDDTPGRSRSLLYNPYNEKPGVFNPGPGGSGFGSPHQNYTESEHDRVKVYRGGSWADMPYYLAVGTRRFYNADSAASTIGFRCAMTRVGSPY